MTFASSSRCTPRRSTTTRRSRSFKPASQIAGRPSIGAWLSYGLGTANKNLPSFCVMVTKGKGGQPLYATIVCGAAGFLPSQYQGVAAALGQVTRCCISPTRPASIATCRRSMLDHCRKPSINEQTYEDARLRRSRDAHPDRAVRDGVSHAVVRAREVTDLSKRTGTHLSTMYGPDAENPGTFAANCLLARRLAERRDVRFIQLFHRGWDQHGSSAEADIRNQCRESTNRVPR